MVVQHNLRAMNSNRMLGITSGTLSKSSEKLSSGYKINRAADDAAGLSISEKMRKQIRGLTQATANAEDGISAVQTAEGALTEVHDMLQRMNELAVKAANGTMSESDRTAVQNEVDQLATEIDRVAETTKFNETYLLKGDQTATKGYSYSYKAVATSAAATATMVKDEATDLNATITFNDTDVIADDQNALAKALRDQGITINAKQNDAGTKATYSITLNGSAANAFKVNTMDDDSSKFEIVNLQGKKIAEITASGGTGANVSKESSAVITANTVGAATRQGDVTQFYDADGNAVSANALGSYFSKLSSDGTDPTIVIAADMFDKDGNKFTKGTDEAAAAKFVAKGGQLYKAEPRTATSVGVGTITLTKYGDMKVGETYEYVLVNDRIPSKGDTTTSTAGWYNVRTGEAVTGAVVVTGGDPTVAGSKVLIGTDNTQAAVAGTGAAAGTYKYTPGVSSVAAQAGKQLYDAVGNKLTMTTAAASVAANQNLTGALSLSLHVGADATKNNQIDLKIEAMSAKGLGINGIRVDGKDDSNALKSVETIKEAVQKVSAQRSALGAVQNRLEHTINNLENVVENTTSAESAIRDTDMATEMVKFSNSNILAQAGQSMLAQANQANQGVLSLLG